jgi:hypothetical protein
MVLASYEKRIKLPRSLGIIRNVGWGCRYVFYHAKAPCPSRWPTINWVNRYVSRLVAPCPIKAIPMLPGLNSSATGTMLIALMCAYLLSRYRSGALGRVNVPIDKQTRTSSTSKETEMERKKREKRVSIRSRL